MSDKYQLLRQSLPELVAEATRQGARNMRSELIIELLEERDALATVRDQIAALRGERRVLVQLLLDLTNVVRFTDIECEQDESRRIAELLERCTAAINAVLTKELHN